MNTYVADDFMAKKVSYRVISLTSEALTCTLETINGSRVPEDGRTVRIIPNIGQWREVDAKRVETMPFKAWLAGR